MRKNASGVLIIALAVSVFTCRPIMATAVVPDCTATLVGTDTEAKVKTLKLVLTTLGAKDSPAKTKFLQSYLKENYYQLCLTALIVDENPKTNPFPLVIKNNTAYPMLLDSVTFQTSTISVGVPVLTLAPSTSPIILRNVTIITPYRALTVSGPNHQLLHVTLTAPARQPNSLGLQLSGASNLWVEQLAVTDFAQAVRIDPASTATFTAPVLLWKYQAGAPMMQGEVGFGVEASSTAGALPNPVSLLQPQIEGFATGVHVVPGTQLYTYFNHR